ncbi:MAG TPA: hypothetical protein VIJ25_13645, partial [Methylococcales bacterium]
KKSRQRFGRDNQELFIEPTYIPNMPFGLASGSCGGLPLGNTAVFPPKTHGNSHLIDTGNTKRSDSIGVDNGNKRVLRDDQDGQTGFCFVWIAHIVGRVIQHKDAAPDLSKYHYPFELPAKFFPGFEKYVGLI